MNECIAFLRRQPRQAVLVEESTLDLAAEQGGGLAELTGEKERVRLALSRLPLPYQTIVVRYYFEQLSYQEIAEQAGIPVGTVGTQLHLAKQLLKRILNDEEGIAGESPGVRTFETLPVR